MKLRKRVITSTINKVPTKLRKIESNDDCCSKDYSPIYFPNLIFERIFDHMGVDDLLTLRETSKKMKSIVDNSPKLWKKRINVVFKMSNILNEAEKLDNLRKKERIELIENHINHFFDFIYSNENINSIKLYLNIPLRYNSYEIKYENKKLPNDRKLDISVYELDTQQFNKFNFLFCNCNSLTIYTLYHSNKTRIDVTADLSQILKLKLHFHYYYSPGKLFSNGSIFTSLRELHLLRYSDGFESLCSLLKGIRNLDYLELVSCEKLAVIGNEIVEEKRKLKSLHLVRCSFGLTKKMLNLIDLSCVESLSLIHNIRILGYRCTNYHEIFVHSVVEEQHCFNERIEILKFLNGKCTSLVDFTTNFLVDDFISFGFVFEKPLCQLNFVNRSVTRIYEDLHYRFIYRTYGIDSIQQFYNKCLTNESKNSLNKMIVEFNLYRSNSDDSDEVISERFSILKSFIIKMFEQLKNLDQLDVYICDCEIEEDAVKSDLTKFKNYYDKDSFCKLFTKNPGRICNDVANVFVIKRRRER